MIVGIGTDIIEIDRIKKTLSMHFLERYYSETERQFFAAQCKCSLSALEEQLDKFRLVTVVAGNFTVKEAVAKALGTGFAKGVKPKEISVLREINGKPYVELTGQTKQIADALGITSMHVSITNTNIYAQSFVVAENGTL